MAFEGIRPVLHLPFGPEPDQPINHDQLGALVADQLSLGVDGLVVLGLASEAWTLQDRERDDVLATVAVAIDGRVPLVVGIDGTTALAVDRARRAVDIGNAAGLMVLPSASARSTEALVTHFAAIAEAAGVPILVQDSPQVTGITLSVEALLAIHQSHPLIAALKVETPGAGSKTSAVAAAGMEIVAGWGGLHYLESIRRGASGCMPGCDLGPALLAIDRLACGSHVAAADGLYRTILPLLSYEAQSLDLLLLGAKRVLVHRGIFDSGALRAPGRALDQHETASFDAMIARLEGEGVAGFASWTGARADAREGAGHATAADWGSEVRAS